LIADFFTYNFSLQAKSWVKMLGMAVLILQPLQLIGLELFFKMEMVPHQNQVCF